MTEAERITRALPKGKWYRTYGSARCPAHGDVHPSLTLANAPDGKLLLHCKAGCGFTEVLDALRLLGLVEAAGPRPTTDLAALAQGICDDLADAGLDARYAGPVHVAYRCQPMALRRALSKIVGNACRDGGGAVVTLTDAPETGTPPLVTLVVIMAFTDP